MTTSFFVPGANVAKGSMIARFVGKRDDVIAVQAFMRQRGVKCFVVDDHDHELRTYTRRIRAAAMDGALSPQVLAGPVIVRATYRQPRPPSVKRPYPTTKPDLDKMLRATVDALSAKFLFLDDAQVVAFDVLKRYAHPGETPGVEIDVEDAAGQEGLL